MANLCSECQLDELDPANQVQTMRGICDRCWIELPWQERVRVTANHTSSLDNQTSPGAAVSVWSRPYWKLSAEFLKAVGNYPVEKGADVVMYARHATEPANCPADFAWGLLHSGRFACPKGWTTQSKSDQNAWHTRIAPTDGRLGQTSIEIVETPSDARKLLATRKALEERIASYLKVSGRIPAGSATTLQVDQCDAIRADWSSSQGTIRKSVSHGTTTLVAAHGEQVVVDGLWPTATAAALDTYTAIVQSIRIDPPPDDEEANWLRLKANDARAFSALRERFGPTVLSNDSLRRRIREAEGRSVSQWTVGLLATGHAPGGPNDPSARSISLTEARIDAHFWTLIWAISSVTPSLDPGPAAPLLKPLPETFEKLAAQSWLIARVVCLGRSSAEAAELLQLLRDSPTGLQVKMGGVVVSNEACQSASALLQTTMPTTKHIDDLARMVVDPKLGLAFRMRVYRAAEHWCSRGLAKSVRADRREWLAVLGKLGLSEDERESLVETVQSQDFALRVRVTGR